MQSQALVSKFTITNFQSIKSAELSFDTDGNIINIIGLNDVGKSALTRALDCLLYFKYSTAQKSFIRHGEKFFQVAVTFTDGVTIVLERFKDGNSSKAVYHMLDADEKLLFSTARASVNGGKTVYEKVTGVPPEIERYLKMGTFLINGKTASLNSGNRYDPILLVGTSGSDNTRALNSAMKSEELTEAHEAITKANNQLRGKINGSEQVYGEITSMEAKLRGITPTLATTLEEESAQVIALESSVDIKTELLTAIDKYTALRVPPPVEHIDISKLETLTAIYQSIGKYTKIQVPPPVEQLDLSTLKAYESADSILTQLQAIKVPPKVEELNTATYTALGTAFEHLRSYHKNNANLNTLKEQEAQVRANQDKVAKALEAKGYVATYCENCGELSVVDKDGKSVVGATAH